MDRTFGATLRGRPQPRPLDARDDGGPWLGSRRGHGARALLFLGRRRAASWLRFGRAQHHARSPWVARRKHPVQPSLVRRRYHPPRGGASKTIAGPDTSPRYLQLVGDLVYYATDKSIHVMSRSAADASTTRIVLERPAATTVTSFVLITGTLFYTQGSTLRDASSPPPASAVGSTSRKKTRAPRGAPSHQAPTGRGLRMTRKFCRRTWGT